MFQLSWSSRQFDENHKLLKPKIRDQPQQIAKIGFLNWEEHCAECSVPDCYSSCPLYVPRKDLKCARFVYGIIKNKNFLGLDGFGYQIRFRRWGKLETTWPSSPRLLPINNAKIIESYLNRLEAFATKLSNVIATINPKRRINGATIAFVHELIKTFQNTFNIPNDYDGFLLIFYYDNSKEFHLQFEIVDSSGPQFRKSVKAKKGWNKLFIPQDQLPHNISGNIKARIWPETDQEYTLVFTAAHLVKFDTEELTTVNTTTPCGLEKPANTSRIKCVAFDLDNTLWKGVIGDDGSDGIEVNQEAINLIKSLDKRGIICSVVSKNEYQLAWKKIIELGLDQYLLFPKINWYPKSLNILSIAEDMNILPEAIALIDDNPFERAEVSTNLPEARTYDVTEIPIILQHEEFTVPITEQSQVRRISYLQEQKRLKEKTDISGDIDQFLKSCEMTMVILKPDDYFNRCHELVNRTNQFNISGRKYERNELARIVENDLVYCWRVFDKFGDYGVVGFIRLEKKIDHYLVTDFVMSCRIAEKRIEETILGWIQKCVCKNVKLRVKFVPTKRNLPIRKKLEQIGLEIELPDEEGSSFYFNAPTINYPHDLIKIVNEA